MGFSNLLSSALTAVATFSGNPDVQQVANSANELVVSYQAQQQQEMAQRIISSPDGIIPVTEKGKTIWRALKYNADGEITGFADFNTKEEYLVLKQQELRAQQALEQQRKAEQATQRQSTTQTKRAGDVSIADLDAYGQMLGTMQQASMGALRNCSQYVESSPPWNACVQREVQKVEQRR
ncbi:MULTISPECIES: hypothetical protein [Acinetobacter calcoaceticus/baumannii complex]|uniref:hypothetical protein n=1 Tax=Acinetobacter calcoaceticus/baumannii complex TaxID=909768 RepID=UPI00044F2239|nr:MULTISPECIES: hypothetical protein [Acinetobacter calcoaceticus/baumannii complex]EXR43092.1 hypothetical protein J655_1447 [Acinetobacter sp. 1294243]MDX8185978.1 hypothetical protein [Acinetobacter pittii]OCY16044.1 hypothetical protein BFR62_19095 [Acinetobacter pittii]OCZ23273.1 hypothetical protein BFR96_03575 [Acinetobacter pittii]QRO94230.1 hypothetical protein I6J47_14750 [Acinetobacter pittii]